MPAAEQDTAMTPTDHQAAAAAVTEEIFLKTKRDSKHFKMKYLLSLFHSIESCLIFWFSVFLQ
jgi:hypothetical protein